MPSPTDPPHTYLRRPRVLVIDDTPRAADIRPALTRAPVAVHRASDRDAAHRVLNRRFITVIVSSAASAAALDDIPARGRANPSPRYLIVTDARARVPAIPYPHRAAQQPFDARRIVADVLALAHGWDDADTRPVDLDSRLSLVRDCALLFCDGRFVPLLRMERLVLSMLSAEPNRLVTWGDLATATGASRKLLYVSADRLRRKLDEFIPGHGYIATQPGRGLFLDLAEGLQSATHVVR